MDVLVATAAILAILFYGVFPALVRRSFRAPRRIEAVTPASLGLPYQAVHVSTENAKALFAWYVPTRRTGPAPAVALLHGWGGNAQYMLPFARLLHQAGFAVLLLDARNHGKSDADDFSSMVKFAEDLEHGLAWLKARPEIDAARLGVLGHSVGAAAALLAASRRPCLRAVVSVASFAHPAELMRQMMAAYRIPYWPVGWWVLRYIEKQINARYDRIAPVTTIRHIACPVLLIHGEQDRTVPVEDAWAIYRSRADTNVELWTLPHAGHGSVRQIESHGERVADFFKSAFCEEVREDHEGAAGSRGDSGESTASA